jgi:hypothetical protein
MTDKSPFGDPLISGQPYLTIEELVRRALLDSKRFEEDTRRMLPIEAAMLDAHERRQMIGQASNDESFPHNEI